MILRRVPLDSIVVRAQPRASFDEADVRRLADSIAADGLQHPPVCRLEADALVLVDGERRLRALGLQGRTEIDVLVCEDKPGATDVLARQLACNLQRADLRPVERAEGVRRLIELSGQTADAVARRLGQSPATVSRWLAVLTLPEDIRRHVDDGRIAADAAYQLARIRDPAEQAATAKQLADGSLTRDGLARALRKTPKPGKAPGPSTTSRVTAALGQGRSVTIAGRGLTLDAVIEWLEPLLARARRARAKGLSLETFVRTLKDQAAA